MCLCGESCCFGFEDEDESEDENDLITGHESRVRWGTSRIGG